MIYFLRHGQTEYNAENRIQGRCDSPLTARGRAQARALGELLGNELGSDRASIPIIASPQGRAMASARLVREGAGIVAEPVTDERLMEIGCGSWERCTRPELAAANPAFTGKPSFLHAWRDLCPDGERLEEAMERASDWLAWAEGQRLVAVAHGAIGIVLRALHAGTEVDEMLMMPCPQDRIYCLSGGVVSEIGPIDIQA